MAVDASEDRDMVSRPKRDLMSPRSDAEYLNCNRFFRLVRLMIERVDFALVDKMLVLSLASLAF